MPFLKREFRTDSVGFSSFAFFSLLHFAHHLSFRLLLFHRPLFRKEKKEKERRKTGPPRTGWALAELSAVWYGGVGQELRRSILKQEMTSPPAPGKHRTQEKSTAPEKHTGPTGRPIEAFVAILVRLQARKTRAALLKKIVPVWPHHTLSCRFWPTKISHK